MLGRTDILEYLGDSVKHEKLSIRELIGNAAQARDVFAAYEQEAKNPLPVQRMENEWKDKKGAYTLTLQAWSPWMDVDPKLDLSKYPVTVYIPKAYDGTQPYGLILSMMNAKIHESGSGRGLYGHPGQAQAALRGL